MLLARVSLTLSAFAFAAFGTWLLLVPHAISLVGVQLTHPAAVAEIRSFYGGLELGVALFFVLAISRPSWWIPSLVVQSAALGGAAIGRVLGILVDGAGGNLIFALAAAETAGCLLGLIAWLRLRALPDSGSTAAQT